MQYKEAVKILNRCGSEDIETRILEAVRTTNAPIVAFGEIDHNCPVHFRETIARLARQLVREHCSTAALELSSSFDAELAAFEHSGSVAALESAICPRRQIIGQHGSLYCRNRFVIDPAQSENVAGFTDDYSKMLLSLQVAGMRLVCIDVSHNSQEDRDAFMCGRLSTAIAQGDNRTVWVGGARHMIKRPGQLVYAAERLAAKKRVPYTIAGLVRPARYPDHVKPNIDMSWLEGLFTEIKKPIFVKVEDAPQFASITYVADGMPLRFGNWDAVILFP